MTVLREPTRVRMIAGYAALMTVLMGLAAASEGELRCYSCSSYMAQCKTRVDNTQGDVFKTKCGSKCFTRMGEDGAIYRGCFDGFREIPDLIYEYNGCQNQTWNNRALQWCLCDSDLCNGDSMSSMPMITAPAYSRNQYDQYNNVDGYYQEDKYDSGDNYGGDNYAPNKYDTEQYEFYSKDGPAEQKKDMGMHAKTGGAYNEPYENMLEGKPFENIVQTNYGFDVAHNIAPLPPQAFTAHRGPQGPYQGNYGGFNGFPDYLNPNQNPYVDPRFRGQRPTYYIEEKIPEKGYYDQIPSHPYQAPTSGVYTRGPMLDDQGLYKQNGHEPESYSEGPVPREGPILGNGYREPSGPTGASGGNYGTYYTDYPTYGRDGSYGASGFDSNYDRPTASSYGDATPKVQRVSPQLAAQIRCVKTGYYSNPDDCRQFVACLLDPHSKNPIMHLMECPNGLVWDNQKKICMEYSTSCNVGGEYQYDDMRSDYRLEEKQPPINYVEETEQQDTYDSVDTNGFQQGFAQPDILTYYPDDNNVPDQYETKPRDTYLNTDDFKSYGGEEEKYENSLYADEYHKK